MNEYYCLTFDSTHYAIKTEKKIKQHSIKAMMIPTPREISASCGLSLKFDTDVKDTIISLLTDDEKQRMSLFINTNDINSENKYKKLEW